MASLNCMELNFLVFRYLQESGFTHSAFAFWYEASIKWCDVNSCLVRPGALITFVQKGLQYFEMEANLSNVDSDMEEDFSLLQPLDLITEDINELRRRIKERKINELKKPMEKELDREHEGARVVKDREKQTRKREREKDAEKIEDKAREKQPDYQKHKEVDTDHGNQKNVRHERSGVSGGPEPMEIFTTPTSQNLEFATSDITILQGHASEVCACAWNSSGSLLASASGDSTARIWRVGEATHRSSSQNGPSNEIVLLHVDAKTDEKSGDVTSIDWNVDGTLLATGACDGQARIWGIDGELKSTLTKHEKPIFTLKWNKKCDYIVTGSCDHSAIVWDVKAEQLKQQFKFHLGPTLDVDWRNNVSFATSSTDHMIYVCKIGETLPIKSFAGHQGEVNCVKWDPTGSLLASCSDDISAKIWSMKRNKCIHDLKGHGKEIYTIRWSPSGPGTNNPNLPLLLASASFDSTVKIWDTEQGRLIHSLNGHRDPVYSVAFSPNGEYLASGSLDKSVHIWSLKEGKIIKKYTGKGGIFGVSWSKEGDRIAACSVDKVVSVLHFRR